MIGPTLPKDWMEEEFAYLSERIILAKIVYYNPEYFKKLNKKGQLLSQIVDDLYDQFELGYLRLCQELNLPNTLVHKEYPQYSHVPGEGMMEVDFSRKDVQNVLKKYKKKEK